MYFLMTNVGAQIFSNSSEKRERSLWRGDFEGMKRHLLLQNWDTVLVGDIETKWIGFKMVLLGIVEKFCPLARPKRRIAKPWLSRHIKLYKKLACTFPEALSLLQNP